MELKKGMYAYTKDRRYLGIGEITKIDDDRTNFEVAITRNNYQFLAKKEFVIASYKLLDLLVIGDIITTNNLCGEITKIDKESNKIYLACSDYCSVEDIKDILTKEQFERERYKVGE